MFSKQVLFFAVAALIGGLVYMGWKLTSRNGYESAQYTVVESDGAIELREYPDLMLASTEMGTRVQSDDGSFGRLFQYISGANEGNQKVAMTTPVFMERKLDQSNGQMGFVIPKEVAESTIPQPANQKVHVTKRAGGRFAVIRFAGRNGLETQTAQQAILDSWIQEQGYVAAGAPEIASYDPPWTPGPFRRNEILIRIEL